MPIFEHLMQVLGRWKERESCAGGSCGPERFIVATTHSLHPPEGKKIIVLVHVRVRLKDHVAWLEARLKDYFRLKVKAAPPS